jgi:hypothetical protein
MKVLEVHMKSIITLLLLVTTLTGCKTAPKTRRVPHTEPVDIVYRNLDTGSIKTNTVYVDGFIEEEIPEPEPDPIISEEFIDGVLIGAGAILEGLSGKL